MNKTQWLKFIKERNKFKNITDEIDKSLPRLKSILQKFVDSRGENAAYIVQTPVVYNTALDDITSDSEIKLIIVADNPGRREQAAENRRYLVGPSGKIAANFFRDNPALGIDFYKNVIILNKTPIHSPRTVELRELCKLETSGKKNLSRALEESQKKMASILLDFYNVFHCPVWITGYSEMRKGGIFESYTEKLKEISSNIDQLYIFRHFSMNQFTIDLKKQALPGESILKTLSRIGTVYRKKILQ